MTKSFRIIADHMRTATFIIGDDRGVTPSNVDQGYVLRRLIRRAVRHGMQIGMPEGSTPELAKVIIDQYGDVYPCLLYTSPLPPPVGGIRPAEGGARRKRAVKKRRGAGSFPGPVLRGRCG